MPTIFVRSNKILIDLKILKFFYFEKFQFYLHKFQQLDRDDHYLVNDVDLFSAMLVSGIHFLRYNWRILGRPTVTFCLHRSILGTLFVQQLHYNRMFRLLIIFVPLLHLSIN